MLSAEKQQEAVDFLTANESAMWGLANHKFIPGFTKEDLVQEMRLVFLEQLEKDNFNGDKSSMFTWANWIWRSKLDHLFQYHCNRQKRSGAEIIEYNDTLEIIQLDDEQTRDLLASLENVGLSSVERGIIRLVVEGAKLSDVRGMLKKKLDDGTSRSLSNSEWNQAVRNIQVTFRNSAPTYSKWTKGQMKRMVKIGEGDKIA